MKGHDVPYIDSSPSNPGGTSMSEFLKKNIPGLDKPIKPEGVMKKNADGTEVLHIQTEDEARDALNEKIEATKIPEFQQGVKRIITYLDQLNQLLDPDNFKPDNTNLDFGLNHNIMGILAEVQVIQQLSGDEYRTMTRRAMAAESKMSKALGLCQAEQIKYNQGISKSIIPDSRINWLSKEGPAVIRSLKIDLETKITKE